MAWTFKALRAGIAALDPAIISDVDRAAALNAQTQSKAMPVSVSDIEKIIVPTGELFKITTIGSQTPSGAPSDQLIAAAWSFARMMERWQTIEVDNADLWAAAKSTLEGLQSAGVLSAGSVVAIEELRSRQVLVWAPPVTAYDIAAAGAL